MRVLVCVKRVPAPGSRINLTEDSMGVDTAHLGFAMSPHEECGVEAAVQLIEEYGGTSVVLTLGAPEAEEQVRYAASGGANEAVLLTTDGSPWDPQRTAAAIAEAIGSIESESGPFDLILFGNESADSGGFQVGVRVAHRLGRPMVNSIKSLAYDPDAGSFRAGREVDGGLEVYEVPAPAVLGVKEGINLPRYPTMKGRLASKKVQVVTSEAEAAAGGQSLIELLQPAETESNTVILGNGPDAAGSVVDLLDELGVL